MGLVHDWEKMEPYLPPEDLQPFGIDELPDAIARPYTERTGRAGASSTSAPPTGATPPTRTTSCAGRTATASTVLPDGSEIRGSGRAVIYADMWSAILKDVPRAVAVSLLATLCIVAIAFRERRAMTRVVLSLMVGVFWTVGMLALWQVQAELPELHRPAGHLRHRRGLRGEHRAARPRAPRSAGGAPVAPDGAVILCSLTTLLGYLALARSLNYGVRSLGVTAVIGEAACLLAAVVWLPAALLWFRQRRAAAEAIPSGEAATS